MKWDKAGKNATNRVVTCGLGDVVQWGPCRMDFEARGLVDTWFAQRRVEPEGAARPVMARGSAIFEVCRASDFRP